MIIQTILSTIVAVTTFAAPGYPAEVNEVPVEGDVISWFQRSAISEVNSGNERSIDNSELINSISAHRVSAPVRVWQISEKGDIYPINEWTAAILDANDIPVGTVTAWKGETSEGVQFAYYDNDVLVGYEILRMAGRSGERLLADQTGQGRAILDNSSTSIRTVSDSEKLALNLTVNDYSSLVLQKDNMSSEQSALVGGVGKPVVSDTPNARLLWVVCATAFILGFGGICARTYLHHKLKG
jgi:hypothetical protein